MIQAAPELFGPRGSRVQLLDSSERARVDAALGMWRQGDCVVGEQWFTFQIAEGAPLTQSAAVAAEAQSVVAESEVLGFAVVTQTCDIVRRCEDRPFIEVCPLVQVDELAFREIQRALRPNYAFIAGVADQQLVADLDRTMTMEKPVVAGWERVPGCRDDEEVRDFAEALARKRNRFAFPNDFVAFASRFRRRMIEKHGKVSDEGRALQALREIRVQAAPDWDADEVQLTFWFIRHARPSEFDGRWDEHLDRWLGLVEPDLRFAKVDGVVCTLDEMRARDFVESDKLDLDHLSAGTGNNPT